jgi:hypothetical protein
MRHEPIVFCRAARRAALLLALCPLLFAFCPSASAQFTTNVWPSWEWQFRGHAQKDQAIAAINERCQALGVSQLSYPGWFQQHPALYQVKDKLKNIIPSFIDTVNFDQAKLFYRDWPWLDITNWPTLSVTTVLARAGAPTNYFGQYTPWFDLDAVSNGWRHVPGIVSQLLWTVASVDFWNGNPRPMLYGDGDSGVDAAAAYADMVSNLVLVADGSAQGYLYQSLTALYTTNYAADCRFGQERKFTTVPTNFAPYGLAFFNVISNYTYFDTFDTYYVQGVNAADYTLGASGEVSVVVGNTNFWPLVYWPDFPTNVGTSKTTGWTEYGDTYFLLKWDGTNGFKYR